MTATSEHHSATYVPANDAAHLRARLDEHGVAIDDLGDEGAEVVPEHPYDDLINKPRTAAYLPVRSAEVLRSEPA